MKICHVTFDHRLNYGSSLQAYALEEVLRRGGHQTALCSFTNCQNIIQHHYGRQKTLGMMGSLAIYRFVFRQFDKNRIKKYTHTLKCNQVQTIRRLDTDYDAFITGSDVVWNTDHNGKSALFYLDFTSKYKFSYAASFGKGTLNAEDERLAARYLPELDAISVREKSSAINAARFTDKPIDIVVDPVLLLTREDWLAIAEKRERKPYIFVYATYLTDGLPDFLAKLKEETGLEVIWAAAGVKVMLKRKQFRYYSPEEWLGLLDGAEYVVTNSFHATAFSTMFHKNFFSFVPGDGKKGIGSRLYDFLEPFGLENRIYSACPAELDLTPPDFTRADAQIPLLREQSMAFLKRNLDAAEQRLAETTR